VIDCLTDLKTTANNNFFFHFHFILMPRPLTGVIHIDAVSVVIINPHFGLIFRIVIENIR